MKFSFLLLFLISSSIFAQNKGKIIGKVIDAQSNVALSFATIRVFNATDNKLIAGSIANEQGEFSAETLFGEFYADVEFMGYKSFKTAHFQITKAKPMQDLGLIKLISSAQNLEEVVVQAEKSSMELALDKRIFNVGKDLANAGGTAIDILGNVPSVSVDTEGNVKLRGSENVRILIDGKPSGLVSFKGGAGLQQLQGNQIEKIEVITNPSARYEAEGMAGIINIILKKQTKQGFNGSFEIITGYQPNYGLAANINYRKNKVNFFLNYGLAYRIPLMAGKLYQEVYGKDTTFLLQQTSLSHIKTVANTVRGGLDYYFNDKNILTAFYQFRRTDVLRITDNHYKDYFNSLNTQPFNTYRQQRETEAEPYSEYALTYKKNYAQKGKELNFDARYLTYWERSDQIFTQDGFMPDGKINLKRTLVQKSLNDEFENQLAIQLDYTNPIGKDGKFETGLRSSFRDMVNDFVVTERNNSGVFVPLAGLDNYFTYQEKINGVYGILGNKTKEFSYQFGLRAEITDIKTALQKTKQENLRHYNNLFPSAHLTYNVSKENAFQVSYSRRVRRPTYNDLTPFVTFSDQRNFFSGNPDLNPEFSNAFDLGHIRYFDKGSMSSSLYYRHTDGKVIRIRRVDALGVSNTRPENLSTENAFGAEFTLGLNPQKWWKMDFNANFFRAITNGANLDANFQSDTYSWFARQTSRFTLAKNTDFQVRANYEAPQLMPQGYRKARFFADLSLSKDILKGKGTLNFNVVDVLNSRYMRTITEGVAFYSEGTFGMRARQMNLTLNYRLNQSKQVSKKRTEGEEGN